MKRGPPTSALLPFTPLFRSQLNWYVRASIAEALGQLGERSIVPQLVALLSDEQLNPDVRASIARALGHLGERSIALQLVALLSDEQLNPDVRASRAEE